MSVRRVATCVLRKSVQELLGHRDVATTTKYAMR
ncbi:site-specific recombinase XerD [Aminobacter niigataensis]|uniref:Site-specific recombinase XerD n=1 Tax=Aminobacter niigataensis TaxID=83265 RepID=A0ABR6KZ87_9HYPH|nr:site-specific recombinase XerD [Aminobacter niigataensis]